MALHHKPDTSESGFEVGDLVWGKVKIKAASQTRFLWWPGYICHEEFSPHPIVGKDKVAGHVLVVFFGRRSSLYWVHPSLVIPFEENFETMSAQSDKGILARAIEEANYVLCRLRGLGLVGRCRNKSNFQPSKVEGFLEIDVGDDQSRPHSVGQIGKARWKALYDKTYVPGLEDKVQKRPCEELNYENSCLVENKKRRLLNVVASETSTEPQQLPVAGSLCAESVGFSTSPLQVPPVDEAKNERNRAGKQLALSAASVKRTVVKSTPNPVRPVSRPGEPIKGGRKGGLLEHTRRSHPSAHLTDKVHKRSEGVKKANISETRARLGQLPVANGLRAERGKKPSASPLQVSLVDETRAGQKNVGMGMGYNRLEVEAVKKGFQSRVNENRSVLSQPAKNEANGAGKQLTVSATSLKRTAAKSAPNPVMPSVKRKHDSLEHTEQIRKKVNGKDVKNDEQHCDLEEIGKKLKTKVMGSGDMKNRKATESKLLACKMEMQSRASVPEVSYRMVQSSEVLNPTKLATKFQSNSSLPSAAECKPQVQLKSCSEKPAREGHNGNSKGPYQLKDSFDIGKRTRNDQIPVAAGLCSATNAGSRNLQKFATKTNDLGRNIRSNERIFEKDKVHKRPGGELSLVENKKKKLIISETRAEHVQLPVARGLCADREKASPSPLQVSLVDETPAGQKNVGMGYHRLEAQTGKSGFRSRINKKTSVLSPVAKTETNGAGNQLGVSVSSVERTALKSAPNPLATKFRPNSSLQSAAEHDVRFQHSEALDSKDRNIRSNLFRNLVKVAEPKPYRVPKEFGSVNNSQPQVQLKSCMKEPAREGHNGNSKGQSQLIVPFAGLSSATNAGGKNLQKFAFSQPKVSCARSLQRPNFPLNVQSTQQHGLNHPPPPHIDAPQKTTKELMMDLMRTCYILVDRVKRQKGYAATYRPL